MSQQEVCSTKILAAAARLRDRAQRDARGQFLIEGARNVALALEAGALHSLLYSASPHPLAARLIQQARAQNIVCAATTRAQLKALAQGQDPQGLVGIAARQALTLAEARAHSGLWMALESIRSPGNLGSMLRTCQAVGARGIIAVGAGPGVDFFDPASVRAAMGAFWGQTLVRADWNEVFAFRARHHPFWVGTALENARPYDAIAYPRDLWLWMGDERRGLSRLALKACDTLAHIPLRGAVDSLNVGVAAGVMLYEMLRQSEMKNGPKHQKT